jgi:hypothetical protein
MNGSMNQNGDIQASTVGFSALKVFLSINGNGVNCQDIRLLHAQPEFFAAFGYSPSDLPMNLEALLSVDGEQEIVTSMVSALLAGLQGSYFLNFRNRSNAAVPCHVTLSTGGCVTMNVSAERSDVTRRFAILTIRSTTVASLAGSAMSAPLAAHNFRTPDESVSAVDANVHAALSIFTENTSETDQQQLAILPPAKKCRPSSPELGL